MRYTPSHPWLLHEKQPDASLLRRVRLLENENETLRERLEMLVDSLTARTVLPVEWEMTRTQERIVGMLLERVEVSREAIMMLLYGDRASDRDVPATKIVDVFVSKIRRKIEAVLPEIRILPRREVGYYILPKHKVALRAYIDARAVKADDREITK